MFGQGSRDYDEEPGESSHCVTVRVVEMGDTKRAEIELDHLRDRQLLGPASFPLAFLATIPTRPIYSDSIDNPYPPVSRLGPITLRNGSLDSSHLARSQTPLESLAAVVDP